MSSKKKITVEIPEELLAHAQKTSGKGVTATIRQGLQLLAAQEAYRTISGLRGKVQFGATIAELKRDRN